MPCCICYSDIYIYIYIYIYYIHARTISDKPRYVNTVSLTFIEAMPRDTDARNETYEANSKTGAPADQGSLGFCSIVAYTARAIHLARETRKNNRDPANSPTQTEYEEIVAIRHCVRCVLKCVSANAAIH